MKNIFIAILVCFSLNSIAQSLAFPSGYNGNDPMSTHTKKAEVIAVEEVEASYNMSWWGKCHNVASLETTKAWSDASGHYDLWDGGLKTINFVTLREENTGAIISGYVLEQVAVGEKVIVTSNIDSVLNLIR